PLLRIVRTRSLVCPAVNDPKSSDDGSTAITGASAAPAPVPVTLIAFDGVAGSLLAKVRVPLCAPAAVGEKRTVTPWNDPAPTLNGVGEFTNVNCWLELDIEATVSIAVPVLRTNTTKSFVWPVFTEPKSSDDGSRVIIGAWAAPAPDP